MRFKNRYAEENEALKAENAHLRQENEKLLETIDLVARSQRQGGSVSDLNPFCPLCAGKEHIKGHNCLLEICNRVYMEYRKDRKVHST
jgi:hypothetical protein